MTQPWRPVALALLGAALLLAALPPWASGSALQEWQAWWRIPLMLAPTLAVVAALVLLHLADRRAPVAWSVVLRWALVAAYGLPPLGLALMGAGGAALNVLVIGPAIHASPLADSRDAGGLVVVAAWTLAGLGLVVGGLAGALRARRLAPAR